MRYIIIVILFSLFSYSVNAQDCGMIGLLDFWDSIQVVDISVEGVPSNSKTIQLSGFDLDEYPTTYNPQTKNFLVFSEDYDADELCLFVINAETLTGSKYYYNDTIFLANIVYDMVDNKVYAMAAYYVDDEEYDVFTVSVDESNGKLTKIAKVDTAHELDEFIYTFDPVSRNFIFIYYPFEESGYYLYSVNLNTGITKSVIRESDDLDCFGLAYDEDSNFVYLLEDSINSSETQSVVKLYRLNQSTMKYELVKTMGVSPITYPYSSCPPAYNQENKTIYLTDVNELENDYAIVMYNLEKGEISINDSLEHKYGGYIFNINYYCGISPGDDEGTDSIPFVSGDTISITACKKYIFNGDTLYNSGYYPYTIDSDSAVVLDLTILGWPVNVNMVACDSFLFNGKYLKENGLYTATFKSSMDCDSTVFLKLIIDNDPNCGDTLSFISDFSANEISVFPNPTNGELNLSLGEQQTNVHVKVVSVSGQVILQKQYPYAEHISLNMNVPKGLYLVVVASDHMSISVFRVVKN